MSLLAGALSDELCKIGPSTKRGDIRRKVFYFSLLISSCRKRVKRFAEIHFGIFAIATSTTVCGEH